MVLRDSSVFSTFLCNPLSVIYRIKQLLIWLDFILEKNCVETFCWHSTWKYKFLASLVWEQRRYQIRRETSPGPKVRTGGVQAVPRLTSHHCCQISRIIATTAVNHFWTDKARFLCPLSVPRRPRLNYARAVTRGIYSDSLSARNQLPCPVRRR